MDNPLISVLIPAYDVARYLPDCLDSICSQSEPRIEVIVVNDGSTDGTDEVLKRYLATDERIRVFSQGHLGVAAARNRLLDEARGEWLYFCDADDKLAPGALSRILEAMAGLDAVFFGADVFYETEDLEARFPQFKTRYSFSRDFSSPRSGPDFLRDCVEAKEWKPLLWSMFFRRDLLRQHAIRFLPDNIHEDGIFIVELLLHAGRVARIADRLYSRRLREGSIMTTPHPREDFSSYLQNALRTLELGGQCTISPQIRLALGSIVANYLSSARMALSQLQDSDNEWIAENRPCEFVFAKILSKTRTEEEFQQKLRAIVQRDEKIAALGDKILHRDQKIASLNERIAGRDTKIAALDKKIALRDKKIALWDKKIVSRDDKIAQQARKIVLYGEKIAHRDHKIALLDATVARRDEKIALLGETISRRDARITALKEEVATNRTRIRTLLSSRSYRLGKAMLAIPRFFLSLRHKN